jgi:ATP-dependent DNA helicase RecG
MNKNYKITIKELSEEIRISTRAVEKNIEKLKHAGKIVRVGSDKAGYWKITNR